MTGSEVGPPLGSTIDFDDLRSPAEVARAVGLKVEINLQVRWDAARKVWLLCPWGAKRGTVDAQAVWFADVPIKTWKVSPDKQVVIDAGAALGAFIASEWNTDGSCELVIRTKRGSIVKGSSGRRTYGRDPGRSKG